MLNKYIRYDIESLIKDYKDNQVTLTNLRTQLGSLDGFGSGQDGERVQSSPSGDGMDRLLLRREQIQNKIDEYNKMFNIYDNAWDSLNEQEQFILTEFLQKNQSKVMACEVVRQKYFLQPSRVYDLRKEALRHMRGLVFGE